MPRSARLTLTLLAVLAAGPVMSVLATGPAAAQDYLSRAEVEAHMRDSVFCYYPSDRTACAWAELYTEFAEDHVIMFSASAVWLEPMSVVEFRVDWREGALCVPYEDQGLISAWEAEGYRFPFDLEGLTRLSEEELPELIALFAEGAPRDFCFQYSADPEVPGQLLQHVFRDGVEDAERDPVALIPRWASGVAINPSE